MDNIRLFLFAAIAFVAMLIWQQWQLDYGPQPVVSSDPVDSSVITQTDGNTLGNMDLPDQAEGLTPATSGGSQESTVTSGPGRLITV